VAVHRGRYGRPSAPKRARATIVNAVNHTFLRVSTARVDLLSKNADEDRGFLVLERKMKRYILEKIRLFELISIKFN